MKNPFIYKFKTEIDINSLLKMTKIKDNIFIHYPSDFFSEYKFIGKYNDEGELLLLYNKWNGNIPIAVISETVTKEYDVEIRYDNISKIIFILMYLMISVFFIISLCIKSLLMAIFAITFGVMIILLKYLIFKAFTKKYKEFLN